MYLAATSLDLGRFLHYLAERQEVISANIANADTPGYKTQDVEEDFGSLLAESRDAIVEVPGLTSKNDGNNVSIDREARLLAETTVRFTLATQLIRGQIKDLRMAIEEGRSS